LKLKLKFLIFLKSGGIEHSDEEARERFFVEASTQRRFLESFERRFFTDRRRSFTFKRLLSVHHRPIQHDQRRQRDSVGKSGSILHFKEILNLISTCNKIYLTIGSG